MPEQDGTYDLSALLNRRITDRQIACDRPTFDMDNRSFFEVLEAKIASYRGTGDRMSIRLGAYNPEDKLPSCEPQQSLLYAMHDPRFRSALAYTQIPAEMKDGPAATLQEHKTALERKYPEATVEIYRRAPGSAPPQQKMPQPTPQSRKRRPASRSMSGYDWKQAQTGERESD